MANTDILSLPVAVSLSGAEYFPLVQGDTTKRAQTGLLLSGSGTVEDANTVLAGPTSGDAAAATFRALVSADIPNALTLGVAGTSLGSLSLSGNTSGLVTIQPQAAAGTFNFNLPITAGTSGYVLTSGGGASSPMTWTNPSSLGIDLDVGSTAITGGTTTRILYDNAGVLGEYTISGTGSAVAMSAGATITGADINSSIIGGSVRASAAFTTAIANSVVVDGATVPANGLYLPAGNTLGWAVNSTAKLQLSSTAFTLLSGETLNMAGSSSGVVTIQTQAAAGTFNFNLPTGAGSSGQPLISGGGGGSPMTFGTLGVGGGGTGTGTAFTQGSVVFAGASGVYSQDNSNFFWDATNHRLGIGTTIPNGPADFVGASQAASQSDSGLGLLRLATGTAATAEALIFGVHDTDYSWIQAVKPGTAERNLRLQPQGGFVETFVNTITSQETFWFREASGLGNHAGFGSPCFFDLTDVSRNTKRGIEMAVRTTSSTGTINTGGVLINIYTPPDNGGDTSGIFVEQTGGGNAASFFNRAADRPGGYTDYPNDGFAIESGVDGGKHCILTNAVDGYNVYAVQKGTGGNYLAKPDADTNLTRRAFVVLNTAATVEKAYITLAGDASFNSVAAATGTSGGYLIGSQRVLQISGTGHYTVLYTPDDHIFFQGGDSTDRTNYYDSTAHQFRTVDGGAPLALLNSTGLSIQAGNAISLGTAGTGASSLVFPNATSGTITLSPVTGALGSVTLSLPAVTDTLAGKALANGGTNAALTANVGGIIYSSASAMAVLSGTATARQMLQSGASAAPAWSTTTWPATTTANRLLYSSATSVISDLATANSSILVTDGSGVPSLSTTLPAYTLGGTVSGGGNQINNVIIGTSTPLAGSFTTLSASTSVNSAAGADGGYKIGAARILEVSPTGHYTIMFSPDAHVFFQGGDSSDPTSYFDNTTTQFRTLDGGANIAKFTAAGLTMQAGLVLTLASTTSTAGINLPHGSAPTSPVNGDLWTTTSGLFVRINGVTVGPLT